MLNRFRNMNAREVHDSSRRNGALVSYQSPVAVVEDGNLRLGPDFQYSVSTVRQLTTWLRQVFGIDACIADIRKKVHSGEIPVNITWTDVFQSERRCGR